MKNEQFKNKNDIVDRSYQFALRVVKFVRAMPKETAGFVLGRQLLASGTSVAANIEEAQGAFSKDDFIYKMQTAFKEALEASLWLRLISDAEMMKTQELKDLIQESTEVKKILSSIVKASKVKH